MKKVKVKINGVWEDKIAINGSTSGFSYQSWLNYVAVRNRTKTTIEAGDIDFKTMTGANSAAYLFYNLVHLTSVNIDFRSMAGTTCMSACFQGCTGLTTIRLNLAALAGTNPVASVFFLCSSINNLIIDGMSSAYIGWGQNSGNTNLFAQTQLATCQNLTITVPILPNLYLAIMTSLNLASVVQVLGQLFDYSAGVAHTITFNRAFTGLSQSDYDLINNAKTVANARNWTVAGLTYSM